MKTEHKKKLLKLLSKEIKKAEKLAEERRETAKNFRSASRSQQGDRRLFETAADLAESKLEELVLFKKELEAASEKTEEKIVPFSFVSLRYEDGRENNFYFVSRRIQIPDVLLVTNQSPLGRAIEGKKIKESFNYQLIKDEKPCSVNGEILQIE